jgi:hypothetical protein
VVARHLPAGTPQPARRAGALRGTEPLLTRRHQVSGFRFSC